MLPEQHVEDPGDPAVAGGLALGQLLVGEDLGVLEPALHESDPGEHREGPVEAAPVVELAEHVGGGGEPAVGQVGVAPEERDGGQVLDRPRLAAAVADPAEELERLGHVDLGGVEIALEHDGPAPGPERIGLAGRIVEPAPQLDRLIERRDRRLVVALHLLEVAEQDEGPGRDPLVVGILEDVLDVGARRDELPLLGQRRGRGRAGAASG